MNFGKILFLLCMMWCCALTGHAQEDEYELPEFDDNGASDIEVADGDTAVMDVVKMEASWTPEQRWVYQLGQRLDSVLLRDLYTTRTIRKGRGKKARRVTQRVKRGYRVGIQVYDLTADSVIYSHAAHDLFIPASNQKLFVSIAALSTIGSDYNFTTDIVVDGTEETDVQKRYRTKCDTIAAEDGTQVVHVDTLDVEEVERSYLKGNVYVRGGFDPTLGKDAVDYVVGKLMALDLDSLDGVVYAYEPQRSQVSGAWFWEKHPSRHFSSLLYKAMCENGIAFARPDAYASLSTPCDLKGRKVTSLGTSLISMLHGMMKSSDNYYAESMLLNLCDLREADKWTYDGCRQVVRDMVQRAGGQEGEYTIVDGSGLSHGNKSTPAALTAILRYAYHDKNIYEPLYESLPIAGVDGTLGSRMKGTVACRNVRAKTGTVSGVSTLAGYVTAANGHFLAFSILINNVSSSAVGRHLQDLLCIEMAK